MRLLWLGCILSAASVSANPSAGYQTKDTAASVLGTATIPQASTSAVSPSTAAAAADQWKCATCQHVYDPAKDGGGKAFEDLPDTFKCPVCGSPKSAFKKQVASDGSAYWAHEHMEKPLVPSADIYKCATCQHIYDPVKDGGGKAFEDLPDTFKCPVCGSPKSAFKKQVAGDGSAYWAHEHVEKPLVPSAETYKCATCQHIYDPVKDGGGKAFEDLPDTFKCPVCGSPKSAFKKQVAGDGSAYWAHEHMEKPLVPSAETYKCATCQHIYDPVKDGGGKAFEDLPDTFKCPVCGSPKSAFKKQVAGDGSAYWAHEHMEKPLVPSADTYKCATCQHVYDPVKDGGGKAFEDLPDTFKCPVCGSPKSAFKKQVSSDGGAYWAHEHEDASVIV